ncbi:MAG: Xaa-Pro peptidase family protein [Gaiellaceae bacterium]
MSRIDSLREQLDEPFLVTNLVNVRYLTEFESSNVALLVEQDRVRLFTDFRYVSAARDVQGVEAFEISRNLLAGLAGELSGTVGFESASITHAGYETLAEGGLELVPRKGVVEVLRAVKDERELDRIRKAATIADRVYERLTEERFVGRTERDLVWRVHELLHEEGADTAGFDPIVAAGPTGAIPHAHPGDRVIGSGETIVVDLGAQLDGYTSDCTRTFATGELPERLRDAYEVCRQAQAAGLEAVRPGVTGRDADDAARRVIEASPFAGAFGHGLGHGVGMQVHEAPTLRPESEDVLEAGNVVTVEPGIYLEGEGGIRIEDLVIVTGDGCDILSRFTKDLVTVN